MKLRQVLMLMGILFAIITSLIPVFGFAYAQMPGNAGLVIGLASLYRFPLIAFLGVLPTLIFVHIEPAAIFKLTVRGAAHALLTVGAVMGAFYFYGWLERSNLWVFFSLTVVGYVIGWFIAFISYRLYTKSAEARLKAKLELQQKEAEQQGLERYMAELERQQSAIRKFKHDYQNILLSINVFLQEKDWDGLSQYYAAKIEVASQAIAKDDLVLESLHKIRVREIKSILVAKLMIAQTLGISVTFEADEEIDQIPVDSVALVRMLGILLDNAIEALAEVGEGKLFVGCFKWDACISFIVQNTCAPNMPELHRLWKPGFSTKGEGRGLGLPNLLELADSQPNVTLETSIEAGDFVQRLAVHGER